MWPVVLFLAMAEWSAWKYVPLERKNSDGLWSPLHLKSRDFQDTRFQYRWKSERTIDNYVCTVEVRPTDDIGQSEVLPELTISYYDPSVMTPGHFRDFTAHNVSVSKSEHAIFKPSDCRRIDFVYWRK